MVYSYIAKPEQTPGEAEKSHAFHYSDNTIVDPMKLFIRVQQDRPDFWPRYSAR